MKCRSRRGSGGVGAGAVAQVAAADLLDHLVEGDRRGRRRPARRSGAGSARRGGRRGRTCRGCRGRRGCRCRAPRARRRSAARPRAAGRPGAGAPPGRPRSPRPPPPPPACGCAPRPARRRGGPRSCRRPGGPGATSAAPAIRDRVLAVGGSTPLSSTLRPIARYMAPVSRKGTPSRRGERGAPRCSCRRPTGRRWRRSAGTSCRPCLGLRLDPALAPPGSCTGQGAAGAAAARFLGGGLPGRACGRRRSSCWPRRCRAPSASRPGGFAGWPVLPRRLPAVPAAFLRADRLLPLRGGRAALRQLAPPPASVSSRSAPTRQVGVAQRPDRHPAELQDRWPMRKNISRIWRVRPSASSTPTRCCRPVSPRRGAPRAGEEPRDLGRQRCACRRCTMPRRRRSICAPPGVPLTFDLVGLGAAVARVGDALRELAVVGEQQQPLGLEVEAAHRHQRLAHRRRHEVDHRRPPLGVGRPC